MAPSNTPVARNPEQEPAAKAGARVEGPVPLGLTHLSSPASRVFVFLNKRRLKVWLLWVIAFLVLAGLGLVEIHTSLLQSWLFTRVNEQVSYELAAGVSPSIAFPRPAPFDGRRGYSKIPSFQTRLQTQGYQLTQQARHSETLLNLIRRGVSPPYDERPGTGIDIRGFDGAPLFRYAQSEFLFEKIDHIPPLLVKTLLFLENRDLGRPSTSWQNPAIEWERLFKAGLLYIGSKLSLPVAVQGGSTLAVQLEKFRHSPNGRTDTPVEKFRQVVSASLKAYREGKNTRAWRERIIVDYLNTVPLAAAPGYGEIHGLGEGLHAWFGMPLSEVVAALNAPAMTPAKVRAFKHVLALLISVRAPSVFLGEERAALDQKVARFIGLMAKRRIIDEAMAKALLRTSVEFLPAAPLPPQPSSGKNKAANAIRVTMMEHLAVTNLYDLDRLHLDVQSTIDVGLQKKVTDFLHSLTDPEVIQAKGLNGERLLQNADPAKVVYSFLLVEPTAEGNFVRVQADNLAAPFDFNKSVKLELGSTAKLRTLTHYLEIMAELHKEFAPVGDGEPTKQIADARDPLTRWAGEVLRTEKNLALEPFLERALERRYSADPSEAFFTGGGVHHFENFEREENSRVPTVREALRNSTNLAFIRLMRDLVAYHRTRLSYNSDEALSDAGHPERKRLLQEIAEEESLPALRRAYQSYRGQTQKELLNRFIGTKANANRRLAILFFAWRIGGDEKALADWLVQNGAPTTAEEVAKLFRAYRSSRLNLADYAYLLSVHPLDLWSAGELRKNTNLSWQDLFARSREARRVGSSWLLNPRNRRAQDLRLRIRVEKDAFARMTPYWQRLGFPFKTMVPSYATAIGVSSDRPVALAELVGILVNDGVRRQPTSLTHIHFARATPYETVFERTADKGEQVLAPEVARTMRKAMAEVVEQGTARRLSGVFKLPDGKRISVGGKTGSGDNRFETFNRAGDVVTSRATNRTAAFIFYIGERYYGVVTAFVQGREADDYHFTSALPVTVLKLLAPTIIARLDKSAAPTTPPTAPSKENQTGAPVGSVQFAINQ
ncbi:MAG: transglycosylase domain-containing protein [Deltaproteobacteria bacterium]|nr:transglycosylase domain-containing protein [Deltaproteobacteria bacterium]